MSLTFNTEQMEALVAKAIIDGLTDEQRSSMIQEAIKGIISKPADPRNYNDKRSQLQVAFDCAVSAYAEKYARLQLETDETFKSGVAALFTAAIKRLFEDSEREEIITGIANTIKRGLSKDRY